MAKNRKSSSSDSPSERIDDLTSDESGTAPNPYEQLSGEAAVDQEAQGDAPAIPDAGSAAEPPRGEEGGSTPPPPGLSPVPPATQAGSLNDRLSAFLLRLVKGRFLIPTGMKREARKLMEEMEQAAK